MVLVLMAMVVIAAAELGAAVARRAPKVAKGDEEEGERARFVERNSARLDPRHDRESKLAPLVSPAWKLMGSANVGANRVAARYRTRHTAKITLLSSLSNQTTTKNS